MQYLVSGFVLGMVGIAHCMGMCSPLLFVIKKNWNSSATLYSYHLGRVTSYLSLGIVASILGYVGSWTIKGNYLSLVSGVLLMASLYIPSSIRYFVEMKLKPLFGTSSYTTTPFLFGIANGLLPCGLVYTALAAAVSINSFSGPLFFMSGFSIATIPALTFGQYILTKIPFRINKRNISMAVAILLIIRGLSLGIPYMSPSHPSGIILDDKTITPNQECK